MAVGLARPPAGGAVAAGAGSTATAMPVMHRPGRMDGGRPQAASYRRIVRRCGSGLDRDRHAGRRIGQDGWMAVGLKRPPAGGSSVVVGADSTATAMPS